MKANRTHEKSRGRSRPVTEAEKVELELVKKLRNSKGFDSVHGYYHALVFSAMLNTSTMTKGEQRI